MFHPDFYSVYSDNWFTEQAYKDGVVIDARDKITFEHLHPAFGKAEMDATYMRGNSEMAYITGSRHLRRLQSGCITSHDVHGWCNFFAFYQAMSDTLKDGDVFVEVGAWQGQSLIHLAQRCQDLGKSPSICAVDTFKGEAGQVEHTDLVAELGGSVRAKFEENIQRAGVADMVTIIEGDSAESAAEFEDGEIAGVFIDAAHDYISACRDLAAWFPKVRRGGMFCGHDYHYPPVRTAVDEFAQQAGLHVGSMGTVWFCPVPKYSQCGQCIVIDNWCKARGITNGTYLDVGAFDGVEFSNTKRLEDEGWEGICIEPLERNFELLEKSRKCKCIKCAIAEEEGPVTMYVPDVAGAKADPSWYATATLNPKMKDWWHRKMADERDEISWMEESVMAARLSSILPEDFKPDVVSIDCDGTDLAVLRTYPFDIHKPPLIVIEYGDAKQGIIDYLTPLGYVVHHDNNQDLFFELP